VRTTPREEFVYAGELKFRKHKPFVDAKTARPQIKFVWDLKQPLPDELLQELTFGLEHTQKGDHKSTTRTSVGRSRSPSSFDELKKAYTYVLGGPGDRIVVPEHQHYQVKLKNFLVSRGVHADMEADFIDVSFSVPETECIGEIKVTRNLTLAQAFRAALGQVIEYGYLRCRKLPHMIIFLDQCLDPERLKIATALGISVVAFEHETFTTLNPEVAPGGLLKLFSGAQSAGA
jgi:hypothetical protein